MKNVSVYKSIMRTKREET